MFPILPRISEFFHSPAVNAAPTTTTSANRVTSSTLLSTTWDHHIPKLSHYDVSPDVSNAVRAASQLRVIQATKPPSRSPPNSTAAQSSPKTPAPNTPAPYTALPSSPVPKTPSPQTKATHSPPSNRSPPRQILPAQAHEPKTPPPTICTDSAKCCDVGLKEVKAELDDEELWAKFHDVGNEMLITRSGRLMFPVLRFKLRGLSHDDAYKVGITFPFADDHRYRFSPGKISWKTLFCEKTGTTAANDDVAQSRYYEHSMSPASGEQWGLWRVSFAKVKLSTCKENARPNNVIYLPAMRKYRIQLVVTKLRCAQCQKSHTRHIDVPLTDFIAVTTYNNHNLKQLKIENNPHARYLLDDDLKKGTSCASKGARAGKKAAKARSKKTNKPNKESSKTSKKAAKTTKTSRKRKREDVPDTTPAPSAELSPEPSPKITSYWCQKIESLPENTLPAAACREETPFIDLNSKIDVLETGPKLSHYYDNPYGNELEFAFSLSRKNTAHTEVPDFTSYQSYEVTSPTATMLPCCCNNLCGQYYTLNYDSYYGGADNQLQYSGVKQYHVL